MKAEIKARTLLQQGKKHSDWGGIVLQYPSNPALGLFQNMGEKLTPGLLLNGVIERRA
jgi:hypothetical protein